MTGRLLVVCGLPGAGKTTLARQLAERHDAVRMCPDEDMIERGIDLFDEAARADIEAGQWLEAQQLLGAGRTVVIEWGVWSRSERDELRDGARSLGAAVELHFLDAAVDVLWARIEARQLEGRFGSRPIRRDEIDRWAEQLEPPDDAELATYDNYG